MTEGRERGEKLKQGLTPSQNCATVALRISGPGQTGSVKDTKGKEMYQHQTGRH